MYSIPTFYDEYLRRRDREWLVKANVNGVDYENNVVVDFEIENNLVSAEEFEIGAAILSKLTIRLKTNEIIPPNAKIVPYVSLSLNGITWEEANIPWQDASFQWFGGTMDWLPLGEFYVDSRVQVNDVWVFTCYDKLVWSDVPYISQLTYPATMKSVWDEICNNLGYTYDSSVIINPAYMIQVGLAGYSMRQILGYIASANSASVYVGKDGNLKFKSYSAIDTPVFDIDMSDYVRAKQTNPIKSYTRVIVTYNTEDGLTYEAGTGDENHTLYVENPFMTQAMTNDLLSKLNGFSYMPIDMDVRGYPQLEVGDVLSFKRNESAAWIDTNTAWSDADFLWDGNKTYQTIILHQVYSFKGGLKMSIKAPSKSEQKSEFVVEGTLSQQVNRLNQNAVKQGKKYYGVTITKQDGLIVERDDHASKAVFNSDELTFYKGTDKALWFDVPTDTYKFSGVIEASSFIGGSIQIGSSFSVNSSGHMIAVGADFSGNISASTITGGTIIGSYIATSTAYPRIELSNTGNLLGALTDANNHIDIVPYYSTTGSPAVQFYRSGALQATLVGLLGGLQATVPSTGYFYVGGGELFVKNVNNITDGINTIGSLLNTRVRSGGGQDIMLQWFSNYVEVWVGGVYKGRMNLT